MLIISNTAKNVGQDRGPTPDTADKRCIKISTSNQRMSSGLSQKGEEKAMLNLEDLPSDKLIRLFDGNCPEAIAQ
ncbi:unnamed protein product [Penicillium roqueforti FM164]|uniref:Genomic scaffold, ProqFM164S04 n=1 Tax=Penicillium roqueforti (strain FM164) TaxID=1365484 RepID=W6QEX0_PENRF|nr:unnamed protein product [Penicillium roqueforti FM164]